MHVRCCECNLFFVSTNYKVQITGTIIHHCWQPLDGISVWHHLVNDFR